MHQEQHWPCVPICVWTWKLPQQHVLTPNCLHTLCLDWEKLCRAKIILHVQSNRNGTIQIHGIATNLTEWHQYPAGHAFPPTTASSFFLFTLKLHRIIVSLPSAWEEHFNEIFSPVLDSDVAVKTYRSDICLRKEYVYLAASHLPLQTWVFGNCR